MLEVKRAMCPRRYERRAPESPDLVTVLTTASAHRRIWVDVPISARYLPFRFDRGRPQPAAGRSDMAGVSAAATGTATSATASAGTAPGAPLASRIAHWAASRPGAAAYTFMDYGADPDGVPRILTWADLHRRAAALSCRIAAVAAAGDRVAVLAPTGPEYVVSLVAAWYAGTIAVPLFPPSMPGHGERLAATYVDCAPSAALTTSAEASTVRGFMYEVGAAVPVLVVGDDDAAPANWAPRPADPSGIAYLQYTSGSTRTPAGVQVTHHNLAANVEQIQTALTQGRTRLYGVNWLPLFHDMGLLASVAVPMRHGGESVLLDPVAFLMRPARWLRLLSGRRDAYTAAPNFAYDYALRRIRPGELSGLDLSGVFLWLNGAEPVVPETMERFIEWLRPVGLDPCSVSPGYGLAEATLFVAGSPTDQPLRTLRLDRDRLNAGAAVPAEPGSAVSTVASCGRPSGQQVAIVETDPGTGRGTALPAGRVGEIWVHGPNVGAGYWGHPPLSGRTFDAVLARPAPGLPAAGWLRTGDLGLLHDGELYVTGRLKDLIVLAGTNHYPQDIEATVLAVSPALGLAAAFAVTVAGEERAVVVVERARRVPAGGARPDELVRDIRHAVWAAHQLPLHDLVLTAPGAVPRTSSGKTSRSACRDRWLAGSFPQASSLSGAGRGVQAMAADPLGQDLAAWVGQRPYP
jgi:fatty acid CoA ligase FadD32